MENMKKNSTEKSINIIFFSPLFQLLEILDTN